MNCKGCLLAGTALLLGGLLAFGLFTIAIGYFLAADDVISQADGLVIPGGESGGFFMVQHAGRSSMKATPPR